MAFHPAKKGPDYARLHSQLNNSKLQVQGQINNQALYQTIGGLITGVQVFQQLVNETEGGLAELLAVLGIEVAGRNSKNFGCSVTNSVKINLLDTTLTVLPFDTDVFNTGDMHSTSIDNSRIYATAEAQWLITGQILFEGTAGGNARKMIVTKNGTTDILYFNERGILNGQLPMCGLVYLDKDDYIEVYVFQDSGTTLLTQGNVQMVRISYS